MMPGAGAGRDETAPARMGIIEINDLVYKLESDLSVAINRTHKNNYFQQTQYDPTQTSICILNSGADYIDPRRSFLSVQIVIPYTDITGIGSSDPNYTAYINAYFGANGSVLNLIDSVVVSTRSGDELSRVNDFAQLMYNYIPWTFGRDWARTVGQQIGLGSFLGGGNIVNGSVNVVSPNYRNTFQIPMYLVSPVFTYGRLLPSMLMSGMKIEIRWKPLIVAAQQYWEGQMNFLYTPLVDVPQLSTGVYANNNVVEAMTKDRGYLYGSAIDPLARVTIGLDPTITNATLYTFTPTGVATLQYYLSIEASPVHNSWSITSQFTNETGAPGNPQYPARPPWLPGVDQVGFEMKDATSGATYEAIWEVIAVVDADTIIIGNGNSATPTVATPIAIPSLFRQVINAFPNRQQHAFNAPQGRYFRGLVELSIGRTGANPLLSYTISNPYFQLCSVQLTDSIQRHLNEYSATNGLEIVYADWDRTAASISGTTASVYTEVRKSASRALMAFSVVTNPLGSGSYFQDSYRSVGFWTDYQYQLGSLYFPQQRVESKGSSDPINVQSNMYTLTYNYAMDAWDRLHPKAAPTLVSLFGNLMPLGGAFDLYETEQPSETRYDGNWLIASSNFGQTGSFSNGLQCVATTLERSTMFDLSGIPINNSRVLAIRGSFTLPSTVATVTQYVFLKYVRLARVFLINAEVEQ